MKSRFHDATPGKVAWRARSGSRPGRLPYPGRLCDLLHIIYRAADDELRGPSRSLRNIARHDLLKENVDGEAIAWRRLCETGRSNEKILFVISDGAPVDDSTLAGNDLGYLGRHLGEEIASINRAGDIQLAAIGLDHYVSEYYSNSIIIASPDELAARVIPFVAANTIAALESCRSDIEPASNAD